MADAIASQDQHHADTVAHRGAGWPGWEMDEAAGSSADVPESAEADNARLAEERDPLPAEPGGRPGHDLRRQPLHDVWFVSRDHTR
jgi:hypothetical protein